AGEGAHVIVVGELRIDCAHRLSIGVIPLGKASVVVHVGRRIVHGEGMTQRLFSRGSVGSKTVGSACIVIGLSQCPHSRTLGHLHPGDVVVRASGIGNPPVAHSAIGIQLDDFLKTSYGLCTMKAITPNKSSIKPGLCFCGTGCYGPTITA